MTSKYYRIRIMNIAELKEKIKESNEVLSNDYLLKATRKGIEKDKILFEKELKKRTIEAQER